jgi:methionyl-tRNA formyltransferase
MGKKYICIAGKNSIAIAGLSYILENYSETAIIYALCDKNDVGVDSWQPSYKKFARDSGVEIVALEDLYQIENLSFISLEYFRLIDPKKFKTKNLFNIHFSLLPAYKGMYTSAHPILNGEDAVGCTFHYIDAGIDTGAIISQVDFKLAPDESCKAVYEKYLLYGRELTFNTIDALIENDFQSSEQASVGASYYSNKSIDYSNLVVDLAKNSSDVSKQIRAYTFRDYQLPCIHGFEIFGHLISDTPSTEAAGSVLEITEDYLIVSTNDFDMTLYLDRFQSLIDAVSENNKGKVAAVLKSNPFIIDENDKRGWTALIISSYNGYDDITDFLLDAGASPTKPNPRGTVPLMYAKEHALQTGNLHGLVTLLASGADKTHKDIFRKTIYDYLDSESEYYQSVCDVLA